MGSGGSWLPQSLAQHHCVQSVQAGTALAAQLWAEVLVPEGLLGQGEQDLGSPPPLQHLSNPCCSPQGPLQAGLSLVPAGRNLKAETPSGPGCPQPCHGRGQLLWAAAAAGPTSPCPHTSSSCRWLKMKWKWNENVKALSSCWTGDKKKCFRNKRWSMQQPELLAIDNWQCALIFICPTWFIVAGAAFQGERLLSCCCYKGCLIFFS